MTLEKARQRYLRLVKKLPTFNDVAEPADINELFDQAMAMIAQQCCFYSPAISFTLSANTAEYQLDGAGFEKRITTPVRINVNGVNLLDRAGYPGLWSIAEFEKAYPNFHSSTPGQPTVAVWYGNTLRLHEPPSTSFAASASAFVAGEYVPGWREGATYYNLAGSATTSSTPDLPSQFHELIPELAAQLGTMGVANSEDAWAVVRIRQGHLVNQLDRLRRKNIESRSSTPYRGTAIGWIDF